MNYKTNNILIKHHIECKGGDIQFFVALHNYTETITYKS